MPDISPGQGLVILGLLYLANTVVAGVIADFFQRRRLASEEKQADSMANATTSVKVAGKLSQNLRHRGN